MIPLQTITTANETLSTRLPSPVCVFVGGTTGIGAATLKRLAANTVSPKVYFVGRTLANGEAMQKKLEEINPKGTYIFLQYDILLIKNVDECCKQILDREKEINILWLSAGAVAFGVPETSEGLNFMAAISYYTQYRFLPNLLPLLKQSAANQHFTRVIRIFAGGLERTLDPDDLDMSKSSFARARQYHITMNTVALDQLSHDNPEISFVHAYAGLVITEGHTFPGLLSLVVRTVTFIAGRWLTTPLEESAERNLFYATSEIYPSAAETAAKGKVSGEDTKEELGEGKDIAVGLDGVKGSGCYTLHSNGTAKSGNRMLMEYRQNGFREKVWEHTLNVYKRIEAKNQKEEAGL